MELVILKDLVIIFALSTIVNLLFTRLKVPTVIGYLMTGVIAGPHLLSLVKSGHEIEIIAEIGVIILLFAIGMEFSLKHLLKIRRIVFFGGLLQVSITALVFYFTSKVYGLSWQASLFMGFVASLSSSALVLKLLQERSELTSNYGRTVLGILIFQDILVVPLLLFTELMGNSSVDMSNEILLLLGKAALIIAIVYVGNKWLLPFLLHHIAMAKNQELFTLSIFCICLSIALLTSYLGMSLAFGAFLAGLMVSESEYSHNAFGNLAPFKDTFTSFFFVSIGMLLNVSFVVENIWLVGISVFMVLTVKSMIAGATGFVLGHTFRGTVLVGLALCQVGEFSFILAKQGYAYNIITEYYYQLFLAVAVITMAATPFLMKVSVRTANMLLKLPLPSFLVEGLFPLQEIDIPEIRNHVVIIGKDTSALELSTMAQRANIEHVSIIFDPVLSKEKMQKGFNVVYGDAVNEPILYKAHAQNADIIVISVGSIIPAMAIVERVRIVNPKAFLLVRAAHIDNIEQLYNLGADYVFPEKLEIGIDMFRRVLVQKLYPQREVTKMVSTIREKTLGAYMEKDLAHRSHILDEMTDIEVTTVKAEPGSFCEGKSILETGLRKKTGVTLLAIKRGMEMLQHPSPDNLIMAHDIVYLVGSNEQINNACKLFIDESSQNQRN